MPDAIPDTTPDTAAPARPPRPPPPRRTPFLERLFRIHQRGSTVGQEVRGGFATFFTMAYIVVLNPLILGFVKDADGQYLGGGATPNLAAIAAGTALVAGVMTILMGVFANYPLALATGLGLNAFVAFSIASQMTWADAMGIIVLEGLVILVLVLTGFRTAVFHAVPSQLKVAISVGIGLFIALIGLVDAGFVRRTGAGPVPVELGIGGQLTGWPTVVFVLGLGLLITLWVRKVKGAIIISILAMTVVAFVVEAIAKVGPGHRRRRRRQQIVNPTGWNLNVPAWPSTDRPDQLRHARRVQPARVLRAGRHRRHPPARLHPDARRLLRHHGHDDGDRRRGRPARRGRHAAQHPAHPRRRLARRGRRWRGRRLVEHLLHRVGLGCRRGGAHRPGLGRDRRCSSSCRSS